jgi:hypothetical protein
MDRRPGALTLSEDDRRVLAVWAADCAERVQPYFDARAPDDPRPQQAIDGLRAFARGQLRIGPVRALAVAAHAAARQVGDPAAVAAARAAGQAAGTAHMAAHARGASGYASVAVRLAASGGPAAADEEARWQLSHADPVVREILRKLPPPPRAASELARRINELHRGITEDPRSGSRTRTEERDAP